MSSNNSNEDSNLDANQNLNANLDTRKLEPLSPQGIKVFEQLLRESTSPSVAAEPDRHQLVHYLTGLLAPQEARRVERSINTSGTGRTQLLAIQKILRRLRTAPWTEVEQQARTGDEVAAIWRDLVNAQAVVHEEGHALWSTLPCVNVWTEIQEQMLAGREEAQAAWTTFLNFARQWKSLRRIEGLRPATAKGIENRPAIYAPQKETGGMRASRIELNTDLDPQLETIDFHWNAQITQAGDLSIEAIWTVEDLSGVGFQPTGALLSLRMLSALWPVSVSECVDQTEQEFESPVRTWAAIWVVPGFGRALELRPGRLNASNFRIDLTDRPPTEFLTEPLPELLDDLLSESPESRIALTWPSHDSASVQRTPTVTGVMVAEIYSEDGEPTGAAPILISLVAPPVWKAGELIIAPLISDLVRNTYSNSTLVIEAGITAHCWQQLGVWPLRDWPTDNTPARLTMRAPGEPDVPFTTPLRLRVVQT